MFTRQMESLRTINGPLVDRIVGHPSRDFFDLRETTKQLTPAFLTEQRLRAQAAEVALIVDDATNIERLFQREQLPLPSAYALLTAGYDVPPNAKKIGTYGEGAFAGFPSPAIAGHAGETYAASAGDKTVMLLKGRAHPNEWTGERFGSMVVAHPLRVIQELIRRQRARDHVDPSVILTYLTGVAEGYRMKPGDLGIILDDAEGTNILHPGHGPTELLDEYVGSHFQPKMGRVCDMQSAKTFVSSAKELNVQVFPVTAYGTPGTTEYQGFQEAALGVLMFEQAKKMGLSDYARSIFDEDAEDNLAPLFDMGITYELATLRQTHPGETDIRMLPIGLATDSVGGQQSLTVNHGEVVRSALATGERNSRLIVHFLSTVTRESVMDAGMPDFSIQHKLETLRI